MRPSNMGGGRERGLLGPGPLMTSHLQVTNLDRELNELRRKRELIQREQQMLSLESDMVRKRQYAQANRNVPNMFEKVWQPPPKRANGPQQMRPWRATTQDYTLNMSKPMPSNYIPSLLDSRVGMPRRPIMPSSSIAKPIVHPILQDNIGGRSQPALRARNNFGVSSQSNKVMKKRPQDPPNKLNSYPVNKRNDLVSKALDKPITADKTAPQVVEKPDALILREDQPPSKRVNGRLELALGSMVKDIKLANSDNVEFQQLIMKNTHLRIMKQEIRDRIRIVMLNQAVGQVTDIVKKYRQKFPKETDKDIVDLVMNYVHHKSDSIVETENPKEFFKKNIESILEKKLKEMSQNLLKMYVSRQSTKAKTDANLKLEKSVKKESETNFVETMKILRSITGKYVVAEERDVLNKYYTELIENILEEKIPEYLPKCKEQFLKIFDLDKRMAHIENLANKAVAASAEKKLNETGDTVANDNDNVGAETLEKDEVAEEDDGEVNDSSEKETDEMVIEPTTENNKTLKTNDAQTEVVSKNIPVKETVSDAEKHVAMETDKTEDVRPVTVDPIKASPKAATPVPNKTQLSAATTEPKTPVPNKTQVLSARIKPDTPMPKKAQLSCTSPKTPILPGTPSAKELPYFIKLIGRPKLPARPVICDFLNNYKPASIKKHKSINNLLVVGFKNEDDYNRILKANETVVGDITIIIKGSEKVISGKENEPIKETNDVQKQNGKEINADAQNVTQNSAMEEIKDGKDAQGEIKDCKDAQGEIKDGKDAQGKIKNCKDAQGEIKDGNDAQGEIKDGRDAQEKITATAQNLEDSKDLIGPELDDQITKLLTTIRESDEDKLEENSNKEALEMNEDKKLESTDSGKGSLAPIKEDEAEVKNGDKNDSDKVKGTKANVKDTATPVRSSSRLASVTPSTIRTRRTSRLMQE